MSRSGLSRMRLSALVLLGLVALAVAGCGGGGASSSSSGDEAAPKPGGTLRIAQEAEAENINPLETVDNSGANVVSQIVEPLFKLNAQEELEPWLASSVKKSDDERVWTLQLRKGVQFSTGQPMTSADVLFTLEQARKSVIWESLLANIEKVEAPSPSTIVIRNAKPAPELEVNLSQWSFGIVPKDWEGKTEKEFGQDPIGTGPFTLGQWKHGESITLDKNPRYWQKDRPYLDKVVFHSVPSPDSRVAQLKGDQLDAIYQPPFSQLDAIESSPDFKVGDYPMGLVEFLILNSHDSLFENQKVREAVELAVDREGLNNAALFGHGEPAGAWVAPAMPGSAAETIEPAAQDQKRARTLLTEAEKEGADPSFTLASSAESGYWQSGAQIVQQNLEEVGFKVTIEPINVATLFENLGSDDYDMAAVEVYPSTPSPAELLSYYNVTEAFYTGADTSTTSKLTNRAIRTTSPAKRNDDWRQIQEIIKEEQFLLPTTYSQFEWALKANVSGFYVPLTGLLWLGDTGFTD